METLKMKNINSILIANRGEISRRISRTCRQMGIRSVAVYTEVDRDLPYVSDADTAICIGQDRADESFLDQDKIIAAARRTGADAIHPGYGFLSENADFAQRCADEGLIFIGPHPEAIASMGSKSQAKAIMEAHDVPVVPGYRGEDQSEQALRSAAEEIGYPLLIKAAAGGGGKGMRIAHNAQELPDAIATAKREALNAFGDDELILERYISSGRHIEFQIFGDQHGRVIHLLERECTIQRRYQKVVEESPSPIMTDKLRAEMGESAVRAAQALDYDNAGTVEFIYDDQSGEYFFLEVNTRLQVEHPVTEEITGLDLVQMQIESAMGLPLKITQEQVESQGYAIELRLYAEDPDQDFMPQTGRVAAYSWPEIEGLRVESAIQTGSDISIYYDPMIAKLIIHDDTRIGAIRKMRYLLSEMVCLGLRTNQAFLSRLMAQESFIRGEYDTHYIAQHEEVLIGQATSEVAIHEAIIADALSGWLERQQSQILLRSIPSGWRNNFYQPQILKYEAAGAEYQLHYRYLDGTFDIEIGEKKYNVKDVAQSDHIIACAIDGMVQRYEVHSADDVSYVHHPRYGQFILQRLPRYPLKEVQVEKGAYLSPMPSQVVSVLVTAGQEVAQGDPLMVLNSMKMENTIEAQIDGVVEEIYVSDSQTIEANYLMLKIKEK